eukprot:scaffold1483_cov379-Prasinococcus_capsulatus_cf.AAC.16
MPARAESLDVPGAPPHRASPLRQGESPAGPRQFPPCDEDIPASCPAGSASAGSYFARPPGRVQMMAEAGAADRSGADRGSTAPPRHLGCWRSDARARVGGPVAGHDLREGSHPLSAALYKWSIVESPEVLLTRAHSLPPPPPRAGQRRRGPPARARRGGRKPYPAQTTIDLTTYAPLP